MFTLLVCGSQIFGQAHYKDMIYSNVSISTVQYSDTFAQSMDIYQPVGDSSCFRPVLILAHGGSFINGTRADDNAVVTLCNNFAKRGFVTISIDYRLGNAINMALDSTYAINEVLKSIGDAKAAVRWLRKSAYTGNTYRIDTNFIFCGGNSAGAVLFMHYIYIDSVNEAPSALRNIIINNGGIEGNSGNPGYSSEVRAILSLAGGLNVPEFVGPGSKPIAHFQGDQDNVVPYGCADAEQGAIQVRLCGLSACDPIYNANGVTHVSVVFPGDGHVPWQSDASKMTKVDTICANFLDSTNVFPAITYCALANGINDVTDGKDVTVFPNPAMSQVNVSITNMAAYTTIQLVDGLGRLVQEKPVTTYINTIERNNIAGGVYFVRLVKKDGQTVVKKVVFE
ncbi:MAG: Esterase/lipase-like protein [Bacteroidota bacterium]|nr:Esterase/lipase-like protein [Bacteroidota bacterium]